MRIVIFLFTLFTSISLAQTNAKALKVVKHKTKWKVYKSGMEIPKSHFFRIVNDEQNRDQSILYEKKFMNQRFKLSCYMCGMLRVLHVLYGMQNGRLRVCRLFEAPLSLRPS